MSGFPAESDRLAYSLADFAAAVGVSLDLVRMQIAANKLVPAYVNSKPVILREEGLRWLRSLPTERP